MICETRIDEDAIAILALLVVVASLVWLLRRKASSLDSLVLSR
jgi:hypothetical protein